MSSPIQNKINELSKWSDFSIAQQKANEYLGEDAVLFFSPKENKKYRIYDPIKNKWVDFGQMGYKDGTLNDEDRNNRREKFLKRSVKWSKAEKYSPAYLSYYLLWK